MSPNIRGSTTLQTSNSLMCFALTKSAPSIVAGPIAGSIV